MLSGHHIFLIVGYKHCLKALKKYTIIVLSKKRNDTRVCARAHKHTHTHILGWGKTQDVSPLHKEL